MKQLFLVLILSISGFGFLNIDVHPIHISIAEVDYFTDKKEIQVALKVFTDDLESAIRIDGKKLDLDSPKEVDDAGDYIKKYLAKNFKIITDKKQPVLNYTGKEYIDDAVWIYFYYTDISKRTKSIIIQNTVVMSLHSNQNNLTHFRKNRKLLKSKNLKKNSSTMIINL